MFSSFLKTRDSQVLIIMKRHSTVVILLFPQESSVMFRFALMVLPLQNLFHGGFSQAAVIFVPVDGYSNQLDGKKAGKLWPRDLQENGSALKEGVTFFEGLSWRSAYDPYPIP